jgi:DNA-binding transcriptional LysR family regulator
MELRHLNHFLAVLESGSLGRAAKTLGISEPALSKSIRRLEELLQVRLLDRGPRGMTPTVFGESLAVHARLVQSEIGRALDVLGELKGTGRGVVRIGARPSFGAIILPQAIARLGAEHPGVRVHVREGKPDNLIREVMYGDLDFAVVTIAEAALDESLVQEPLTDSPVAVVARRDHPLQARSPVPLAALRDYPWVTTPRPHSARQKLEQLVAEHDLGPIEIAAESDSVLFLMAYLRASDALSFFPRALAEAAGADSGLRALTVEGMEWRRQLGIVRRRRAGLAPAARLLLGYLRPAETPVGATP